MNPPAFSFRARASAAWLALLVLTFLSATAPGVEVIPQRPRTYFYDPGGFVPASAAAGFNRTLEDFEKETSNQVLVAVYPTMRTDSSVEDYCHRIAVAWQPGQKGKNNGAILFVFVAEHKSRVEVGGGLEGVLTDARCKDIVADMLAPKLKAEDYEGGLRDAIAAILQTARTEYKGSGRTAYDQHRTSILDLGTDDHGWTVERILNLGLFVGLALGALLIVGFFVYIVWTSFTFKPGEHSRDSLPLEEHGHSIYGGHSSGSSSFTMSDTRLAGSAVSGLLSLGSGRGSVAGGVFSAAGGLFFGGGASGDW